MFEQAIIDLKESGNEVGEPRHFQDYLQEQGVRGHRTAQYISINGINDLRQELRDAKCIVFRLGSPQGESGTHFALAKVSQGWSDFFLVDEDVFESYPLTLHLPEVSIRSLFVYQLMPTLTETSLVNLALASGLLPSALGILPGSHTIIPATGRSVFSFNFRPLASCDIHLTHHQGQVEMDALFIGQREGKECLFVVEAKTSKAFSSLAKHKLLYPILAIQENIPAHMEVVPVYLRVIRREGWIEFNIAECSIPREQGDFGALDQLKVEKVSRLSLHGY